MRSLLLTLCVLATMCAQEYSNVDSTLRSIQRSYEEGMYTSTELEARRLLERPMLSDSIRNECDRWIGYSLVAQNRMAAAIDRFTVMLRRDPSYQPDPLLTSPKILAAFDQARDRMSQEKRNDVSALQPDRPAIMRTATFRTIVFPGWEQLYQGRTTAGYVFLSAGAVALTSAIVFDFQRRDARSSYLAAKTPELAQERYAPYNRAYKSEMYAALAFAVIYVASEVDVFLELSRPSDPNPAVSFAPSIQQVTLSLHF